MNEIVPFAPVVEVRATFTPSERLRDALVDFLDPELDQKTKESLRAAFLFKSWRRRVVERRNYYLTEHDKRGFVYEATVRFAALVRTPVLLTGAMGVAQGNKNDRILFRTMSNNLIVKTREILDGVPTVEIRPSGADTQNLFYVDIAKQSLASRSNIDAASYLLRRSIADETNTTLYYFKPANIVVRSSFADIIPPVQGDSTD